MENQLIIIRRWLAFFMISLFLSGLTAMPLESWQGIRNWELGIK